MGKEEGIGGRGRERQKERRQDLDKHNEKHNPQKIITLDVDTKFLEHSDNTDVSCSLPVFVYPGLRRPTTEHIQC